MNYCEYEMKKRIENKKQRFIKLSVLVGALFLSCIILIFVFMNKNNNMVFLSSMGLVILIFAEHKIIAKHHPEIIFSKEIKGENIKEIEYLPQSVKIYSAQYKRINSHYKSAHNNTKSIPRNVRAKVYLKLDDENVREIDGLSKAHTDFYEDGDMLLKYAGTKYPIVVNRDTDKQPCPLCGKINSKEKKQCERCGLDIIV